jgi:hypothetical protein
VQDGNQLLDASFVISLAGPVPANAQVPGLIIKYTPDLEMLIDPFIQEHQKHTMKTAVT